MARVAIVGCGFVGRAWAIAFARAGHEIALWDEAPEAAGKAIGFIREVLPDLAANDLLDGRSEDEIVAALHVEADLGKALAGASHVQENAPERLDLKRALFRRLDEHAPKHAILASSSSALLPSKISEGLPGRERCLVVHPLNPPYLIPAIEIVPAPWTSAAAVAQARDFFVAAGHAPIVMKRELDGFVMNRMQGALLEEAFRLVADGYATVEDIDIGLRDGLALRWSFMGPFETIDLNAPGGVRDYVTRYQGIYTNLFPQMQRRVDWAGPVLNEIERDRRKRLPEGEFQKRQVWRDRRLMALAAQKRRAADEIGE